MRRFPAAVVAPLAPLAPLARLAIAACALAACELPPNMPPPASPGPPPPPPTPAHAMDAGSPGDEAARGDNLNIISPQEWLTAHGAREGLEEYDNSGDCGELVVGPAHEPAVLCTDVEDVTGRRDDSVVFRDDDVVFRVVTHQTVRLVRARKVVTVLDVQTRMESLDGPVARIGQRTPGIVEVKLTIAPDGLSAMVDPFDAAVDCTGGSLAAARPDDEADPQIRAALRAWDAFDHELITHICKQRGKYVWKGQRFVHSR